MLMLVAMAAGAETISHVTIGNLVYSLDTDTKVATVTGYYSSNEPTDVVIPNTIEYGGNYSVTTIGAWAFAYCTSLTSIDIPNSVTTIGELAFFIANPLHPSVLHQTILIILALTVFCSIRTRQ